MGTWDRKDSYSRRLREVCWRSYSQHGLSRDVDPELTSSKTVRNETRSRAHRVPLVSDMIEAARGALSCIS